MVKIGEMRLLHPNNLTLVATEKNTSNFVTGLIFLLAGLVTMLFYQPSDNQLLFYGGSAIFAIFGLWVVLSQKNIHLTLEKDSNRATLAVSSVLASRKYTYTFSQISKVQLATDLRKSSNGGGTSETYRLFLLLNDGTTVQLADRQRQFSLGTIFSQLPNFKEGQAIASFVGIPFEQTGPPDFKQTIETIVEAAQKTA